MVYHIHSHRDIAEAVGELKVHRQGNAVADELAKARAQREAPNALVSRAVYAEATQLRNYAVALARRLSSWQPLKRTARKAKTGARRRVAEALPPTHRHAFEPVNGGWRYHLCCGLARVVSSPRIPRECPLFPPRWKLTLEGADKGGHALWFTRAVGVSAGTVMFCSRCGAFTATARVVGLAGPCPGSATTTGAGVRLKRLKGALHPTLRIAMAVPVRVGSRSASCQANLGLEEGEAAALHAGREPDLAPSMLAHQQRADVLGEVSD